MEYEWDENKRTANLKNHGVDFASVLDFEWDSALITEDIRKQYQERRFSAHGLVGRRLHCLVFAVREGKVRVISFRKANKREIKKYEKISNQAAKQR
jgi:uncharacterized DUF497 family protein